MVFFNMNKIVIFSNSNSGRDMPLFRILYPVSPELIGGVENILAVTAEILRRERNLVNMK